MKHITLIIAMVFLGAAAQAEPYASIGHADYKLMSNGIWRQDPFPYDVDTSNVSLSLGWRENDLLGMDKVNMLVGVNLPDHIRSTALASASDENYANYLAGKEDIWPLSTWNGRGKLWGVHILGEYELTDWLYLTGGAWYHWSDWDMDIPDWRYAKDPTCRDPRPYSDPMPMHVSQRDTGWDGVAGFGLKFSDNLRVKFEHWNIDNEHPYPLIVSDKNTLSVEWAFK